MKSYEQWIADLQRDKKKLQAEITALKEQVAQLQIIIDEEAKDSAAVIIERDALRSKADALEKITQHSTLLLEAYNFGQFADDFNQPQALMVRKAIRETCKTLVTLRERSNEP